MGKFLLFILDWFLLLESVFPMTAPLPNRFPKNYFKKVISPELFALAKTL